MAHSPTLSSPPVKVVALAGRRPDALNASVQRFPLARVPVVRQELMQLFKSEAFTILVCAAACGADLLALEVASVLGIKAYIVLPFATEAFRRSSVTDRPGEWGELYDKVIAKARGQDSLFVMQLPEDDPQTYLLANEAIVAKATELIHQFGAALPPTGVIVWEGTSRGIDDVTQHFKETCQQAGFLNAQVLTR